MSFSPTTLNLPTIVIIHDAWHTPTHYSKLIDLLCAEGLEVACPSLPSCSSEADSTYSFNDDVSLMYQLVFDLVSEGKSVICVMHGYGGYIGTEILGELCTGQRAKICRPGGVVHMVWISAVMPGKGVSMQMAMGGEFPDYTPLQKDGTLLILEPDRYLFNDLGAMEMVHWCEHLVPWTARAQDIVCHADTPAYLVCPSTYIICGEDQLISEDGQRYMISLAKEMGATINEEFLEIAGHDPMCSEAESLVAIISGVAATVMGPDLGEDVNADGGDLSQMDGAANALTLEQTDNSEAEPDTMSPTPAELNIPPIHVVPANTPQIPTPPSVTTPSGYQTPREDTDTGVTASDHYGHHNDNTSQGPTHSESRSACCCGGECLCSMERTEEHNCNCSSCAWGDRCACVQARPAAGTDHHERMDSWSSNVVTLGDDDDLDADDGLNFNPTRGNHGIDSADVPKRTLTRSATAPATTEDTSADKQDKASFLPLA